MIRRRLEAAGLAIDEVRVDEPLLENTFVARLRALGQEVHHPPFPGRHAHQELIGRVAIGAKHLTKTFGSFRAVHDVSLQVRYGEVYGLLGANGAGKTTTIKMLCGLVDPTGGAAELAGERRDLRLPSVRQRIGYMSQRFSLYEDLSIDENLAFFAGVYGVPTHERDEKIQWVLQFAGLDGQQDRLVSSLPGGWKQRVAFGAAIMHEPEVLFLDEPTSGVDPVARRAFWSLINRLADAGTAILVTTHYLEEAEQCNRLGLMVAGELVAEGSPSAIKGLQQGHLLELHVDRAAARRRPAQAGDGPLARLAVRRAAARDRGWRRRRRSGPRGRMAGRRRHAHRRRPRGEILARGRVHQHRRAGTRAGQSGEGRLRWHACSRRCARSWFSSPGTGWRWRWR